MPLYSPNRTRGSADPSEPPLDPLLWVMYKERRFLKSISYYPRGQGFIKSISSYTKVSWKHGVTEVCCT